MYLESTDEKYEGAISEKTGTLYVAERIQTQEAVCDHAGLHTGLHHYVYAAVVRVPKRLECVDTPLIFNT